MRAVMGVLALLAISPALSQPRSDSPAFPSRPVRLVTPSAPGSTADLLGRMAAQKLSEFLDDLQEVQDKFDAARRALASASGKLSGGRGNLLGQVEKLRELGAKASKALPAELVERAQVDEVQARLETNGVRPLRGK